MDGNGSIDSYEFTCALAMLSHATLDVISKSYLQEKAELIFNLYDFDGSKFISQDELVILMTNVLSSLNAMKGLKAPSIEEVERKTIETMKKMDTNQDKKVTIQEFKAFLKKDKDILQVLMAFGIAKKEDLGTDFGNGQSGVPDLDADLEAECNPKELQRSEKKDNMKNGIDFKKKDGANKIGGGLFEEEEMGEGDQFMAVKPWVGVVNNSVPTNYKPSKLDGAPPDAQLELEYVHGYRCHDARNNLFYNQEGHVVYHAAGLGIVLNKETNQQRFFRDHNDDVLCCAIDPIGKYVATGQIGPKPWIFVWDSTTMECVYRITGTLTKGIKTICFSNDGKKIAASAMDDEHNIAVYELKQLKAGESLKPIAAGKGTRANILSLGFGPADDVLVATCVKEVNFFTFAGGAIKGKRGTGWGTAGPESVLCQAFVDDTLITGMYSGFLILWKGASCSGKIQAHTEIVNTLKARTEKKGVISGGNDGLVLVWGWNGTALVSEKKFDLKAPELKSLLPKVRSVCDDKNGKILVGSRGGEIIEFGGQGKPPMLMRSHCNGELWGLAPHPTKSEFITVGQDNMLAIWDIATRKQKKFAKLDCSANVLRFTSDGSLLTIGFTNGTLTVLDANFQAKVSRKDRKAEITEIKFSPDNAICAVGAQDSMIYTYDVKANFKPLKKMRGHHSRIQHFDFSMDGRQLMSNCTSYEILFFDIGTGKQNTSGASSNKNEAWATWTCTLGWPVQGIFPPCADGSDINACDRAPDGSILATADDFGMVKLFRYPCPVEQAAFNQFNGHSSHVTNVRFVPKSTYLISTGGEDKCVFQWKYKLDKQSQSESEKSKNDQPDTSNIANDMGDDMFGFQMEEVGGGDQALAVLPFKGAVQHSTPKDFKPTKSMSQAPDGNLTLKYAHGFRSFDTRGNLKYNVKGDIIFTTAAVGVVHNKTKNAQKFFNLHDDDVVSMAIHPNRDIIATGQMAAKGKAKMVDMFVWSSSDQQLKQKLSGFHRRAIRCVSFSPSGNLLLSIGEDDYHSAAVYDWANGKTIASCKVDPDKVFAAEWKSETEFTTVGMKHVKFFTIQGSNITNDKGLYGSIGPTPMICLGYAFGGECFTGTPKGDLIKWNGRSAGKSYKSHTDALWAIQEVQIQNKPHLMTGGNEGKITIWNLQLGVVSTIEIQPLTKFPAGIRSLDFGKDSILVGTRGAEVLEVNLQGKLIKTHIQGHYEAAKQAELWGCATHSKLQQWTTCGADKRIRVWEMDKMINASEEFKEDLTAIDWSTNGSFIVAGDRNSFIYLVDAKSLKTLDQAKGFLANKPNAWIEDLKIAPNDSMVAFGSHGGLSRIDLVKIVGQKLQPFKQVNVKISSALTHMDWSQDSSIIVFNSQAYDLMWLDVNSQQIVNASSTTTLEYASWTCVLGFPVQGIWPGPDFTDVNSTCRNNTMTTLATADDFGKVKLFKYPCAIEGASSKEYGGHSSHVTKVKFSAGDKYVISTGGNDKTVLVWETDFSIEKGGMSQEPDADDDDDDDIADSDLVESKLDMSKVQKQQRKEEEKKASKPPANDPDDPFQMEDVGEGDEFMAVKPWLGQMKEPTDFRKPPKNQNMPPTCQIDLEWVHGYRARDCKNNIAYLSNGNAIWNAAGLAVIQDIQEHTQRHFNAHNDDVTAIAFSPDGKTIATGEVGPKPSIYIWDALTMQIIHTLKGKLTKGIQSLAFSPSGKVLGGVAIDDQHYIAAYNVETGTCIGHDKGDPAFIIELAFKNDTDFCSAGVKHFKHWTLGTNMAAKKGLFGQNCNLLASAKASGDYFLTGTGKGELLVWTGNTVKQAFKLHDRPVDAIHVTDSMVLTGGRDGKVNVLKTGTFQVMHTFSIAETPGVLDPAIRALYLSSDQKKLLTGTYASDIFEFDVNFASKTVGKPRTLVNGHFAPCRKDNNEIWGLSIFPNKEMYISGSDDATLRIWDTKTRKMLKCVRLDIDQAGKEYPLDPKTNELADQVKGRSVDISPDGNLCAVGFRDGSIRIYDTTKWTLGAKKKPRNRWIQDLKFSPDGKKLAVTSHDGFIDVFEIPTMKQLGKMKASTSAVTHMDWSLDSQGIHTNDLSYEILYYNIGSMKQDPGGVSSFRDEPWASWTLPLGWPVQGIWPPGVDGSDINACDRSTGMHPDGYQLIASADDFSKVKVFRFPSMTEDSQALELKGHSSHVTMVKFNKKSNYLFSTGGNDNCVFQWKVTM